MVLSLSFEGKFYKSSKYGVWLLWLLFPSFSVLAQASVSVNLTLNSVTLLSISPNTSTVSMTFQAPSSGGGGLVSPSANTSKWIHFTSAVALNATRRITAQISSGSVPNGVSLRVLAGSAANGAGTLGASSGTVTLSTSAATIINGIGGAYTGTGVSDGYNLQYSVVISNYSQLRQSSATCAIVYTLVDN